MEVIQWLNYMVEDPQQDYSEVMTWCFLLKTLLVGGWTTNSASEGRGTTNSASGGRGTTISARGRGTTNSANGGGLQSLLVREGVQQTLLVGGGV